MSLFKRGRYWWYKFKFKGQTIRESSKMESIDLARKAQRKRQRELEEGGLGLKNADSIPTLEKFSPKLLEEMDRKSADREHPRTAEFYRQTMARILKFKPLAHARLDEIGDRLITRFVTDQRAKGYKAGTVRLSLAVIRQTLLLAVAQDVIGKAPRAALAKWFKALPAKQREFILTGELRDEFIGGLPEPCKTVARFLVDTGLRISECCALTWDKVLLDAEPGFVFVQRGKSKKAKRYIPLTADARKILTKQRTISRSAFVFVRYGERVDKELWYVAPLSRHTVSQQFTTRRREMGLPDDAVLHSTRHTYLTDIAAAGGDAFTIKELAGHASVTTSQRYIHPVSDTMVQAVRRLEAKRKKERQESRPKLRRVKRRGTTVGHNA